MHRGIGRLSCHRRGFRATRIPNTTSASLLHSESKTNTGGCAYAPFDELIERARREQTDSLRLKLFHEADRMAVADRIALIPLFYGRSLAFAKPWVKGWWEFGKSCSSFADLVVEP